MELKYDVKRGADIYRAISSARFRSWISTGYIKRGEVVVWRSGLSGWRKPEDLEELVPVFERWERSQLIKKKAKKRKRPVQGKITAAGAPKRNILIIDNEKDLCSLLSDAISEKGYQVKIANTKREGINCLNNGRHDIVFLDLKLPDGDGMDVLSKINKMNPKPIVNIISAYGSEESKEEAEKKGVYSFIDKPFIDETILESIEQIARGGR